MSRINEKFTELKRKNEKALIAYIMMGFPNEKATITTVRGLVKGGADIIELGFPFSDPLADGPVIQNASTVSLESTGFLYLVAVFGTTGVKTSIKNYTLKAIKNVKKQTKSKIPIGIGFGVSTPEDVKKYIKAGADAVIVGSAYLKLIERTKQQNLESKITSFTKSLKKQTISQ